MKYIILFVISLISITSCTQPNTGPKPTYTIKGRVLNGTTGQAYANQSIDVTVQTKTKTPYASADLGTGMTDAQGNFSVSYTQTSINYNQAYITVSSNFFMLDNIAVNKNIDSTFYLSSMGKIKISLKTNNPLGANDTLFFGTTLLDASGNVTGTEIDTIHHTINGYYKTFRTPPPQITIFVARGWKNFGYNFQTNRFYGNNVKELGIPVRGDPLIDTATVTY